MLYMNRRIGCRSMKLEVICALYWSYSARGMVVVADGRAVAVERLVEAAVGVERPPMLDRQVPRNRARATKASSGLTKIVNLFILVCIRMISPYQCAYLSSVAIKIVGGLLSRERNQFVVITGAIHSELFRAGILMRLQRQR